MSDVSHIGGKRRQDFDDGQNEISGADTGRMRKFLSPDDDRTPDGKRKKREQERMRQTLAELMRDPEYARLYVQLGDRLSQAETQADAALAALHSLLEQIDLVIAQMEAQAARGPDGRLVFRDADGRVVYADGADVPPEIADGIQWPTGAPSAEEYFAVKDNRAALQTQLDEWQSYRNDTLGSVRDRYDDPESPMSKDDMRDALTAIEDQKPAQLIATATTSNAPAVSNAAIPSAFPEM